MDKVGTLSVTPCRRGAKPCDEPAAKYRTFTGGGSVRLDGTLLWFSSLTAITPRDAQKRPPEALGHPERLIPPSKGNKTSGGAPRRAAWGIRGRLRGDG